ncbi:unnamed protein product [Paramecium pentaurelia]|uniref:FHA domain-containing protein n=1 Tax=Paramecium pentaurelia TaxID=43138 RepID=A0A8S1WU30_9CILI|nr:unnamed protein product [Paramecium pentaurelia]
MNHQKTSSITIRAQNQAKKQIQKSLPISEDVQTYTIGCSKSIGDQIVLHKYVDLPFVDSLSKFHFELDFSLLLLPKSKQEFLDEYKEVFQNLNIDQHIIDKIGQFTINSEQRLQIKDISGRIGYPSLINITKECENQVLKKKNVYIIGLSSQIQVEQNNQLFRDFLVSKELFEITKKAIVLGLCSGLDKLFKQSFEGNISKNDFYKTLYSKELEQEFYEFSFKDCLYIKVRDDNIKVQSYLLVENSKNKINIQSTKDLRDIQSYEKCRNSFSVDKLKKSLEIGNSRDKFTIGRNKSSDIQFKSTAVSNYHGMIQYIQKRRKWIIIDGYQSDREWKYSSYGIWLVMKPQQKYYLNYGQMIKVQNLQIIFI